MKRISFFILCIVPHIAFAQNPELTAAIESARTACAGISDELDKMKTLATAGTVVAGAGTLAGGGAVAVRVNGKKEVLSIKIDPDVMDPADPEMLEDLILVAVNEALRQIEEMSQADMNKLTGGLGLPEGML